MVSPRSQLAGVVRNFQKIWVIAQTATSKEPVCRKEEEEERVKKRGTRDAAAKIAGEGKEKKKRNLGADFAA